jgi:ABC-2 type transport system permease protein
MSELAVTPAADAAAAFARWRVARAVALKEWAEMRRDSRLAFLFGLVLLLMLGALAFGAAQHQRLDRARDAAAATDRALWTGQGPKNPHAAAHFGQYAFKPQSPLALADPGVDAYVGEAVWLEAHKQNEAQFRSARDAGVGARLGGLSFAFVLQTIMPLVAILIAFAGFSGERERGTLRQLMSLGAAPVDILAGKALAALGALAALLLPAFAIALLATFLLADHDISVIDQLLRLLALVFGYALYLSGFVFLALGVSAASRSTRTALVTLLAFWLANCFLAPRVMTDVAKRVAALPTALQFRNAIAEDKKKTFGHDETHPAFVAFRDGVLAQYGVSRIEDLPVNFRGLALRKDDENGFAVFDKHFGALQAAFDAQDRLRAAPGFLFPLLAIRPVSTSFAGTDSWHQFDFSTAAEAHRRRIQTAASEDLIHNARYDDSSYAASPDMWARIPAFDYVAPAASFAFSHARGDLVALVLWALLTASLAASAARRLRPL